MSYITRHQRDSLPYVLPLLFAAAAASITVLVWQRRVTTGKGSKRSGKARAASLRAAEPVVGGTDVQEATEGTGPLIHRRYEVELPDRAMSADIVMRLIQLHLTELAPAALARFEKSVGSDVVFRVGDEYEISMFGPWNGTVRVVRMEPDSFTLVTLDGHPEAGHITFSVHDDELAPGSLRVVIESWARARDPLVEAAYSTFKIGKMAQTEVWITFLQRLSELAGVTTRPQVRITTEALPEPASAAKSDE